MKKTAFALSILVVALALGGCSSDSTKVENVPAQPPKEGSQTQGIMNNQKLPDAAKKAIMGSQGGQPGGPSTTK